MGEACKVGSIIFQTASILEHGCCPPSTVAAWLLPPFHRWIMTAAPLPPRVHGCWPPSAVGS